jgi:hypothetical protein
MEFYSADIEMLMSGGTTLHFIALGIQLPVRPTLSGFAPYATLC